MYSVLSIIVTACYSRREVALYSVTTLSLPSHITDERRKTPNKTFLSTTFFDTSRLMYVL